MVTIPILRPLSRPFRRVGWKIMGPFLVLTLIVGAAGSWLTTRHVTGSLEERFTNHLLESSRVASDSIVRREQLHLEVVRTVSFTQGVGEATRKRDVKELESLVAPIAANTNTDRLEVLDQDGNVVFAAGKAVAAETLGNLKPNRSEWYAVSNVLAGNSDGRGDKFAQLGTNEDGFVLVSVGPIFDGEVLVGAVMVATQLRPFLATAKLEILADVTLYGFDGMPLVSSFPVGAGSAESVGREGAAEFAARPGQSLLRRETFANRPYTFLFGEVIVRGDSIGVFSVALADDFILSAGRTTRVQMGLLFGGSAAAVLVIGWWLTRRLTRPLGRLSSTARAVAAGDLSARSGVSGIDEIGQLAASFDAMTARVERQHLGTVRALATAIDARDPYTHGHSVRVGQLAVELGRVLNAPPLLLKHLEIGGYLHDIGKIGIRDHVLLKPGQLTAEERAMIQRHPSVGLEILKHVELPREVLEFVSNHHEKLDGSGYPLGLSADEIGIIPRIGAVADIFDALSTARPYKPAMPLEQSLALLRREAKSGQLDLLVVTAFEGIAERWQERVRIDPSLALHEVPTPNGGTDIELLHARQRPNRDNENRGRVA